MIEIDWHKASRSQILNHITAQEQSGVPVEVDPKWLMTLCEEYWARPWSRPKIDQAACEAIYHAYPRKVGKKIAIEVIGRTIQDLTKRGTSADETAAFLLERVQMFAASPKGAAGQFTPHPSTWFRQGRYNDDPAEWEVVPDEGVKDNGWEAFKNDNHRV